jgi:hypothetical protein
MAVVAQVSKVSVAIVQPKLYRVTLNLKLVDDPTTLLDQDFSLPYRTGDTIGGLATKFGQMMQRAIVDRNAAQGIVTHAAMDTLVTTVQAALDPGA